MKNPKWTRDEILLALDLYFKLEPGQIHARNPAIIELSQILNLLPIHDQLKDKTNFRNPNGVSLKLSNFLAIDPDYSGKGMTAYSALDKKLFDEYVEKRSELKHISNQIKEAVGDHEIRSKLSGMEIESESLAVKEGAVMYKLHKYFERNQAIVRRKKKHFKDKNGRLFCEICGFDFELQYGLVGKDFIECHHKTPLSELNKESNTSLEDLVLVCANCHRMVHRGLIVPT